MVFLDTPLDVAMAHRILRDSESSEYRLQDELKSYLDYGRDAYLELDKQVKPTCDLIIDGSTSIDVVASEIADVVLKTLEKRKR
jgi:uridine kinase